MQARRRQGAQVAPPESLNGTVVLSSFTESARIDDMMNCRDRTGEFRSAVQSFQSRMGGGAVSPVARSMDRREVLQYRSQFALLAKKIGLDISSTFAKLEKLTLLAKDKSVFNDKSSEIQQLSLIIKQDITALNQQIAKLQELVDLQRGLQGKQAQKHSRSVVVSLQSKLATMSNDFGQVLEVRKQSMRQQEERRDHYSQMTSVASSPNSGFSGSLLLQQEGGGAGGAVAIDMEPRYSQQMALIDQNDEYIRSREADMRNIESTLAELSQVFQQLATMVKEQEEMVIRIDQNVDDAHLNVEAAHSELLKYFQSISSNRWLMLKVFAVLIFFFIVFVVFLV